MTQETNTPLVSIITPFLNAGNYLRESIESVLAQTYQNWELILVNDGSADNSSMIAEEYARRHPGKVQTLEHENQGNKGISASRNLAFKHSKGKFIASLDADDIYLPGKLEDQVSILLDQPKAAMLYAATEYWHGWTGDPGDIRKDWVWNRFGTAPNQLVNPPELLRLFLEDGGVVPCMGSLLVRREVIEAIGGWEDSFRGMFEDQIFYAKIASKWPVFIADGCWDKYRQHPDSMCYTVEKAGQTKISREKYLLWLERYLSDQGIGKQSKLWKTLQKKILPFRFSFAGMFDVVKDKATSKIVQFTRK